LFPSTKKRNPPRFKPSSHLLKRNFTRRIFKSRYTPFFNQGFEPISDLFFLRSNIDNAFTQFFGDSGNTTSKDTWAPRLDIKETDKCYVVCAELPGMKKEDVKVTLKGGYLEIEGEVKRSSEEEGEKIHRSERQYGKFFRRIGVPEEVKKESIQAKFENGILEVSVEKPVPAPEEKEVSTSIEIK